MMASLSVRRSVRAAACAAVLALALPAAHALAAQHPHHSSAAPRWLVVKGHTATLTLIAAYTNAISGFNFNGYGNGKMTVTIPVKYRVNVVFSNNGLLPHSAVITAYASRNSTGPFKPAFSGASSPDPTTGTMKGQTQKFSFTASKQGTYAIVCAVPGHAVGGMWDTLRVTGGGSAGLTFKK